MHEVLVNRLGGLSLPRKSVVRLTDRPDMTLDVYRGPKTTKQPNAYFFSFRWFSIYLTTTPDIFLNQTYLVRLGIFHLELGKKHTFWLWEWGRISAPNFGDREP